MEWDSKAIVPCTPSRCIDLLWLFRAVCYQVPEWITDGIGVGVRAQTYTHTCPCRSMGPLMVISERAVLFTAYWISSPMKEQQWYKRTCRYVCVCAFQRMHLCASVFARALSQKQEVSALLWLWVGLCGGLFNVKVNGEHYKTILLALFVFLLQITWDL